MIPLNKYQKKFKREWLNPFAFSFYFFLNVPMGWLSGMKLKELSAKKCISKVPFRWYF